MVIHRHLQPCVINLTYEAQGVCPATGRQLSHCVALVEGGEVARPSNGHGHHSHCARGTPWAARPTPRGDLHTRVLRGGHGQPWEPCRTARRLLTAWAGARGKCRTSN